MCDIDWDGERPSVWTERTVTAKKEHQCDSCGGTIRPGKQYLRHFSVFDGYASDEKLCGACKGVSDDFKKDHGGRVGSPSYMPELLRECIEMEGPQSPASKKWKAALGEMSRRRSRRAKKSVAAPVPAE